MEIQFKTMALYRLKRGSHIATSPAQLRLAAKKMTDSLNARAKAAESQPKQDTLEVIIEWV